MKLFGLSRGCKRASVDSMRANVDFKTFRLMVADHFGIPEDRLSSEVSFSDDLGVDSLSLVNFIVKLERAYAVRIDLDSVFCLKNVGEAYEIFAREASRGRDIG
jgi:acyl carrier protein